MVIDRKQGLIKRKGLTRQELGEIEQLAQLCNSYDHLHIKLNWDILYSRPSNETSDFLYYDNGLLIGYLALFSFSAHEGELSGMVHPTYRRRGIFSQLLREARTECRRCNIANLMLITEQSSQAGLAFIKQLTEDFHHAEYKMALKALPPRLRANPYLQLRLATEADSTMLAHITARAFTMSEYQVNWYTANVMQRSDRYYYLGLLNGVCVGKIEVILNAHEVVICGFGVLPEYQGYGYGRQILIRTLQEIAATGQHQIVLEVEVGNEHALRLYKASGFKVTDCYLYYLLK